MSDDYRTERVDPARRTPALTQGHDGPPRRHSHAHVYEQAHAYEQAQPRRHPQAADLTSVLGLPASAVTPALLEVVTPLLEEIERLHWVVEQASHRTDWVERQSDRHSVVPCLTRRAFVRELETFLAVPACQGTVAVVQVLGVENLRHVHGFAAGEGALRHIAAIILGALRSSDVVGCLGGSDFLALMPGATADQARLKLEAICDRIALTPFLWMGQAAALAPSFGLHALAPGDGGEAAIAAADLARRGVV